MKTLGDRIRELREENDSVVARVGREDRCISPLSYPILSLVDAIHLTSA